MLFLLVVVQGSIRRGIVAVDAVTVDTILGGGNVALGDLGDSIVGDLASVLAVVAAAVVVAGVASTSSDLTFSLARLSFAVA